MASWTLGKIFAVDEEGKESTQDPSVSGSDSDEDDDEALERQAAFNNNKQNSTSANANKESNRSIRRYNEFGDFLSRSERAHHERSKDDQKPSAKGTDGLKVSGKHAHRVSFAAEDKISQVHEVPRIDDEDKEKCFMATADWVSIDSDIDLTTKRWGNHMEGRIAFDEDNNTIRGIEDMIFRLNKSRPIMKHRKSILEEVVRQKSENEYPNWTKLSVISEKSSAAQNKMALELGKEDELENKRIWSPRKAEPPKTVAPSTKKGKDKRKKSFFGLFKKK